MNKINLLPRVYKLIGLIISSLPIFILFSLRIINDENDMPHPIIYKEISQSTMILGLTLIIFSRDKVEDERNNLLRLHAFAVSFIIVIAQFIISPFLNYTALNFSIVLQMCFTYLIYFTLSKSKFFNKLRNDK